mmetsp:Transcript_31815/g.51730  ORF Transcript_31815/g.51730 Transcript_31815/m.51730 type:complete len:212 (+) Transcript_31815:150-785(+)
MKDEDSSANTPATPEQQPEVEDPPTESLPEGLLEKDADAIKLFVGQIPRELDEAALRPVFEAYGPVFDLMVIRDKQTGAHRRCAFFDLLPPRICRKGYSRTAWAEEAAKRPEPAAGAAGRGAGRAREQALRGHGAQGRRRGGPQGGVRPLRRAARGARDPAAGRGQQGLRVREVRRAPGGAGGHRRAARTPHDGGRPPRPRGEVRGQQTRR